MRFRLVCIALCVTRTVAYGQPADAPLRFEVASVKRSQRAGPRSSSWHSGTSPNRYSATNTTLKTMILQAYQIKDYELQCPAWMDTERYDVEAKAAEGTSRTQLWAMLQDLLVDRFQMTVHREQRETIVYTLMVAKNGHRMKESAAADPDPLPPESAVGPPGMPPRFPGPVPKDKDGFPIQSRPGWSSTSADGIVKLTASRETISNLIRLLTNQVGHEIVDQTGLTGKYDFRLEFAGDGRMIAGMPLMPRPTIAQPGGAASATPADLSEPSGPLGPTIFKALQDQLGLKLEAGKAPRPVVVIDKADKTPSGN